MEYAEMQQAFRFQACDRDLQLRFALTDVAQFKIGKIMILIDIKIITHLLPSDHINAIDAAIFTVMYSYANGTLSHQGTTVATGLRDWIYVVPHVRNDVTLLDALKPKLVAVLGRNVIVESYDYLDAYPGDAAMWGYTPGALVLNRR